MNIYNKINAQLRERIRHFFSNLKRKPKGILEKTMLPLFTFFYRQLNCSKEHNFVETPFAGLKRNKQQNFVLVVLFHVGTS